MIINYLLNYVLPNEKGEIELSEELLTEFAHFLYGEMKEFYRSEEGKAYYKEWLKEHPEFAETENKQKQAEKSPPYQVGNF